MFAKHPSTLSLLFNCSSSSWPYHFSSWLLFLLFLISSSIRGALPPPLGFLQGTATAPIPTLSSSLKDWGRTHHTPFQSQVTWQLQPSLFLPSLQTWTEAIFVCLHLLELFHLQKYQEISRELLTVEFIKQSFPPYKEMSESSSLWLSVPRLLREESKGSLSPFSPTLFFLPFQSLLMWLPWLPALTFYQAHLTLSGIQYTHLCMDTLI